MRALKDTPAGGEERQRAANTSEIPIRLPIDPIWRQRDAWLALCAAGLGSILATTALRQRAPTLVGPAIGLLGLQAVLAIWIARERSRGAAELRSSLALALRALAKLSDNVTTIFPEVIRNRADLLYALALLFYEAEDYLEARRHVRALIEGGDRRRGLRTLFALVLNELEAPPAAVDDQLNSELKDHPDDDYALSSACFIEIRRSRRAKSLATKWSHLERARSLRDRLCEVGGEPKWVYGAIATVAMEQLLLTDDADEKKRIAEESLARFEQAPKGIQEDLFDIRGFLTLWGLRNPVRATRQLVEGLARTASAGQIASLNRIGCSLVDQGKKSAAEEWLRAAFEAARAGEPLPEQSRQESAHAAANMAILLGERAEWEPAAGLAALALELHPADPRIAQTYEWIRAHLIDPKRMEPPQPTDV